jgi:hypothetical protein
MRSDERDVFDTSSYPFAARMSTRNSSRCERMLLSGRGYASNASSKLSNSMEQAGSLTACGTVWLCF